MHFNKTILFLILLSSGVFASTPVCWTPDYLGNISAYEFITGYEQYNTTSYNATVAVGDLNAQALTDMGATGMTYITGVQYQDATRNRGAGLLFYDGTVGRYYAVFQYVEADGSPNEIWAIPDLTQTVTGTESYYSNSQEGVMFFGSTAVKFTKAEAYGDGTNTVMDLRYTAVKLGPDHLFANGTWNGVTDTDDTTLAGYITRNFGSAFAGVGAGYLYVSNVSGADIIGAYALDSSIATNDGGTLAWAQIKDFDIDYYACGSLSGQIYFTAIPGSSTCQASENMTTFNCSISGTNYSLPGINVTSVARYQTIPEFRYAFPSSYDNAYHILTTDEECSLGDGNCHFALRKYYDHPSRLAFTWKYRTSLNEEHYSMILGYKVPGDAVSAIDPASVLINTTMDGLESTTCKPGIFGIGAHDYNITLIVGQNSTSYKKSVLQCIPGTTASIVTTYGTDLDTLLPDGATFSANALIGRHADFAPLWVNEYDSFNRFVYIGIVNGDGEPLGQDTTDEFNVGDNDQYNLTYSAFSSGVSQTNTSALSYNTYYYLCQAPTGYTFLSGNGSGYATISSAITSVPIYLQKTKELSLAVTVLNQGSPVVGASCSDGTRYNQTDANGICRLNGLTPSTTYNLSFLYGTTQRVAAFAIGDYYNSPVGGSPYGTGPSCSPAFTGEYQYEIDLSTAQTLLRVWAETGGYSLNNVSIYWDGVFVGATGTTGVLSFPANWAFTDHNLTAIKTGFVTSYNTVKLTDLMQPIPYTITMVSTGETVMPEYDANNMEGGQDYSGLPDLVFSPFALSLIAIGVVIAGVTMMTGMFQAGALCGVIAAIGLVAFGALPIWFGVLIIVLAVAAAWIMIGGL